MRKSQHKSCCIDEMEILLNQIADFQKVLKKTPNVSDPAFIQETRLFKQHIEWKSEDLLQNSRITHQTEQH